MDDISKVALPPLSLPHGAKTIMKYVSLSSDDCIVWAGTVKTDAPSFRINTEWAAWDANEKNKASIQRDVP